MRSSILALLLTTCLSAKEKAPSLIWNHRGSVIAMDVTPDGQSVVTGGVSDHTSVVIWNVKTGKRIRGIDAGAFVFSLDVSPDGKHLATAGFVKNGDDFDYRAAIWDLSTGKKIRILKGYDGGKRPCIAYSPDGKMLATDAFKAVGKTSVGAIQLWDAKTGKSKSFLSGRLVPFGHVAFSPDGKSIAASSWGRASFVSQWKLATGKVLAEMQRHRTWALIRSLEYSNDGSRLLAASGNEVNASKGDVCLWTRGAANQVKHLTGKSLTAVALFEKEKDSILVVGFGGGVERWDVKTRKQKRLGLVRVEFPTMVTSYCLTPDRRYLFLGTGNSDALTAYSPKYGTVKIYDLKNNRERFSPEIEKELARIEAERKSQKEAHAQTIAERNARLKKELTKSPFLKAKLNEANERQLYRTYAQHLNQAQRAIQRGQQSHAMRLLERYVPKKNQRDLRDFAWHRLRRLCSVKTHDLQHDSNLFGRWDEIPPVLSNDGSLLAIPTKDHAITIWNPRSGKRVMHLKGATTKFRHLAFTSDGKWLINAGPDLEEEKESSSVDIWNVKTGKHVQALRNLEVEITSMAISKDSQHLAIGDRIGRLHLWNLKSGELQAKEQVDPKHPLSKLAFSPDGTTIAAFAMNEAIRLWDWKTKKIFLIQEGTKTPIGAESVLFSPDGKWLYSTSGAGLDDGVTSQWDIRDRSKPLLRRQWKDIDRIALSSDGKRLALCQGFSVILWDVEDETMTARVRGATVDPKIVFAPDGKSILTTVPRTPTGHDYWLRRYDSLDGKLISQIRAPRIFAAIHLGNGGEMLAVSESANEREDHIARVVMTQLDAGIRSQTISLVGGFFGIRKLDFDSTDRRLMLADSEKLYLWNLQTDKRQEIYDSAFQPIHPAGFSDDDKTLSLRASDELTIMNARTKKQIATINAKSFFWSFDRQCFYVPYENGVIKWFSSRTGKEAGKVVIRELQNKKIPKGEPAEASVIVSPKRQWILGFGLILWDAKTGKEVHRCKDFAMRSAVFTPDERTLLVSQDNNLVIWELPAMKKKRVIPDVWKPDRKHVLSPDGSVLALEQPDRSIALFKVATGEKIASLTGMSERISTMIYSPDGKTLVTGSTDGTVELWCPKTGSSRLMLSGHETRITSMTFSRDGKTLATGSAATKIMLWLTR